MPLEGPLQAINVWALRDLDGWAIIDTGMYDDATLAAWAAATESLLGERPVTRVFATHLHVDHVGMAGWFTERRGARLWMTRLEYYNLRMLAHDNGLPHADALQFYRSAGMDEDWLELFRSRFERLGPRLHPLPLGFRAIQDRDRFEIDGREWRCVVGRGHSPEHACLWSAEHSILISGDQVLPTISSNVSLHPYEPEADPLSEWLSSLVKIRQVVPDDVLVLPAHGKPFRGLHARIDALVAGHEAGLHRLHDMLKEPRRAVDVFSALFRGQIDGEFTRLLAVGEALAHLACLRSRGLAQAAVDAEGITWWSRR